MTLPISDGTRPASYEKAKFSNTLWTLQLAFRIANRGRLCVLAYTVANTQEDSVAALHFTLMLLYSTLLELLAGRIEPNEHDEEIFQKATARKFGDPKPALGLIGKLRVLVDQLDSDVEVCRQGRLGDVNEDVMRLLGGLSPAFPDDAEAQSSAQSEAELSDTDDDGDGEDFQTDLFDASPLSAGEVQAGLRARRVPGTCEWLLRHEDFGAWAASDVSTTFSLTGSCKCPAFFLLG